MGNKPFLLRPSGKDYLWGGKRLNDEFAKNIDMQPLAETWECSTHPDGECYAASGSFEGMTLAEIIRQNPHFLGTHPKTKGELPIIVKFIDAKTDLSVQVHPDDEYAFANENGQSGKSEMWYVLDSAKDAHLIYGLHHDTTKQQLIKSIADGTVEKYMNKVRIKKGDVFYVNSGTVHAIGAGALIAEIQQNSNLTYRLYDYDRVDKNGQKRRLHIEKALEVANLSGVQSPRQPLRVTGYSVGCAVELLCRCRYFQVSRMIVNTERCRQMAHFCSDSLSFRVLLCVDGCGTMHFCGETLSIFKGDCVFVPADSEQIKIHGIVQFLDVRC